ncbi:MAG TPA: hypothetical protein VI113_09270 [Alphaproteobacteria bacterium]
MPEDKEFDTLPDEKKFSVMREELWALRAEVVSLCGVEGKLTKEIDALKARLAEIESKIGLKATAAGKQG